MRSRVGGIVLKAVGIAGAVWFLLAFAAWLFQKNLIYLPGGALRIPRAVALPRARDVAFETEDHVRLSGWLLPGEGERRFAILVLNGNAGDRSLRAPLAEDLSRSGADVLLFDYRGYAGSPGRPSEAGLIADARAARRYLVERENHESSRLVYFGESLGTAVALALAAESPPAAIVLRSPFPSLADVGRVHYPIFPIRLLLEDSYPCLERAAAVRCPALVVAGDSDRVIPIRLSRRLFEALPGPKRFVSIPGADHNDAALFDGERLVGEVLSFLAPLGGRTEPD